jgi:Lar family restriction alleviation protein
MKKCPFCGETEEIESLLYLDDGSLAPIGSCCMECANCGAHGPWADMEDVAEELWNKRND